MCFISKLRRMPVGDHGATMVEYAFLLLAIAVVVVTAVYFLGGQTSIPYSSVADTLLNN